MIQTTTAATRAFKTTRNLVTVSRRSRGWSCRYGFTNRALSSRVKNLILEDATDAYDVDEYDSETTTTPSPWQTLLEPSARATWRSSTHRPPEALAEAQWSILQQSERTSKQLRRTHQRIVNAHAALAERRERERSRTKNPLFRTDSLAHKKEVNRDAAVSPVHYGPEQTLATLKQRCLVNYAVMKRVLSETKSLVGHPWHPQRVIDFGMGNGGASVAALDVFDTIDWIHGIDPSQSMRDSADIVLKAVSEDRTPAPLVTLSDSLSSSSSSESRSGAFDLALCSYTAMELPHLASTLAAAAVLWEKLRPNGVFVMIEPGTPDGFNTIRSVRSMLLDCCPPDSEEMGSDQCHVLAPCTHNGTCPMERHRRHFKKRLDEAVSDEEDDDGEKFFDDDGDDDEEFLIDDEEDLFPNETPSSATTETDAFQTAFCSFVHVMPGGTLQSRGEKFSYIVAQKRIVGDLESDEERLDRQHNPFHDTNVAKLLRRTLAESNETPAIYRDNQELEYGSELFDAAVDVERRFLGADDELGLDLVRGDLNRKSFGRIIRAPIKRRGHVLLDYCSASDEGQGNGRIVRHRISKGQSAKVAPGLFSAARKARWGGLWPDVTGTELCDELLPEDATPQSQELTFGAQD